MLLQRAHRPPAPPRPVPPDGSWSHDDDAMTLVVVALTHTKAPVVWLLYTSLSSTAMPGSSVSAIETCAMA
ncbi:hypothetical protein JCM8547_008924 [Rhodosporidiobolus lusitaniae]